MSFLNGIEFNKLYYNGVEINKVYLDGSLVWEAISTMAKITILNFYGDEFLEEIEVPFGAYLLSNLPRERGDVRYNKTGYGELENYFYYDGTNNIDVTEDASFQVNADITIYAKFNIEATTIIFKSVNSVYHTGYTLRENGYILENALPFSDPERDGYIFTGWFNNAGGLLSGTSTFPPSVFSGTTFEVNAGWEEDSSSGGGGEFAGQYSIGKKEGIEDVTDSLGFYVLTNNLNSVLNIAFDNGLYYSIPLSVCNYDTSTGLAVCYINLADENFIQGDSLIDLSHFIAELNDGAILPCTINIDSDSTVVLAYESSIYYSGIYDNDSDPEYEGVSCANVVTGNGGLFINGGSIGNVVGPIVTLPEDTTKAIYITYF